MNDDHQYDLIIEPGRGIRHYWCEIGAIESFFFFLAWRDILCAISKLPIGIAWSVLDLSWTMVVFTIVFGKLAKPPLKRSALSDYGLMPLCCRAVLRQLPD